VNRLLRLQSRKIPPQRVLLSNVLWENGPLRIVELDCNCRVSLGQSSRRGQTKTDKFIACGLILVLTYMKTFVPIGTHSNRGTLLSHIIWCPLSLALSFSSGIIPPSRSRLIRVRSPFPVKVLTLDADLLIDLIVCLQIELQFMIWQSIRTNLSVVSTAYEGRTRMLQSESQGY
jgi:hypothetical protein